MARDSLFIHARLRTLIVSTLYSIQPIPILPLISSINTNIITTQYQLQVVAHAAAFDCTWIRVAAKMHI